MGDKSAIEWTDATWNPVAGCTIVSPGCSSCYAMKMAARLDRMGVDKYAGLTKSSKTGAVWTGKIRFDPAALIIPLRWKRPRWIFVNSMSDLFHEGVRDDEIDQVFAVMAQAPQHTFQVLTKRSERMRAYLSAPDCRDRIIAAMYNLGTRFGAIPWPLPNVWLGVSAEDQRRADERIPDLLATPAAIRFISAEPLIGPIDFRRWIPAVHHHPANVPSEQLDELVRAARRSMGPAIDWIIVGGESGPGARSMVLGWAKDIVRQCQAASVAVFVKQLGAKPTNREGQPHFISDKKGNVQADFPEILRVREFPSVAR